MISNNYFNGNLASAGAEGTVAGGGGAMTMKNQNGVVMNVSGTTKGLAFTLGVDGMKVEINMGKLVSRLNKLT